MNNKESLDELKKQERELHNKIDHQEQEQLIEQLEPISKNDFYDYMVAFAKCVLSPSYESWEFEEEDLWTLRRMALRVGLRPDADGIPNDDLQELVDAADEAKKRFKE